MGLVDDDNGGCMEEPTLIEPVIEVDDIVEPFNFKVESAPGATVADWDESADVNYFELIRYKGLYTAIYQPGQTGWTAYSWSCNGDGMSFKLVAHMKDGSTVESNVLGPYWAAKCNE